ncbi:MAG: hypothetical protein R3F50_04515 [Gammaproteobacteria bacterium]|jgi:hypothetical protein
MIRKIVETALLSLLLLFPGFIHADSPRALKADESLVVLDVENMT